MGTLGNMSYVGGIKCLDTVLVAVIQSFIFTCGLQKKSNDEDVRELDLFNRVLLIQNPCFPRGIPVAHAS